MKRILLLILSLLLFACGKPMTAEETQVYRQDKLERIQRKIDNLNQMQHACDKNGGIADIGTYSKGCTTRIECKDGMFRDFSTP